MILHQCRCFQKYVRILLHSLRVFCKAPGGAGSVWKYLEALARATGVSERLAYGFRTEIHLADGDLDQGSLEIHLEAVIERVWRYPWRL